MLDRLFVFALGGIPSPIQASCRSTQQSASPAGTCTLAHSLYTHTHTCATYAHASSTFTFEALQRCQPMARHHSCNKDIAHPPPLSLVTIVLRASYCRDPTTKGNSPHSLATLNIGPAAALNMSVSKGITRLTLFAVPLRLSPT